MESQQHSNEKYYMLVYEKSQGWEVLGLEPVGGSRGSSFLVTMVDEKTEELVCDEYSKDEIPWDLMEQIC